MSRVFLLSILVATASLGSSRAVAQTNDNFVNRLTLTGSALTAISNNSAATREASEPNHAGAAAGRSLWYTWTAPTTGTVNLSTYYTGAGAPTVRVVAVYTGSSLDGLTEVASSNNQAQAAYAAGTYSSPLIAGGSSINIPVTNGTVYQIAVDAVTTPTPVTDDGTVVLAINAPPTILSAASLTGTTGANLVYTVAASAGATSFAATSLPPGLSINASSNQITGVPTTAGTYTFGVSATGPGGTGVGTVTLRVNDPPPSGPTVPPVPTLTNAASARGYAGATFSLTLSGTGAPTAFAAANLPPGLALNSTTGVISGIPTTAGTFSVPVSASNGTGTGSATLTIAIYGVTPVPIITSALAVTGTVGSSLVYSITTNLDGAGIGFAPTSWTAASLPPGLTKGSSANYFSGTPTTAGVYTVPISAANTAGIRGAAVTITIVASGTNSANASAAPVLSSAATAWGTVGTTFSYALTASNAPTGFGASNLPPGLSINNATGVISGTPTAGGVYASTVVASNSYGISTATLTLTVYFNLTAQVAANGYALPVITSAATAGGYVGRTLSYPLTVTYQGATTVAGGNWSFSASGLPPGLSLGSTSGFIGSTTIFGTPTTVGTYTASVTATCPAYSGGYAPHPAATASATVTFIVCPAASAPPLVPVIDSYVGAEGVTGVAFGYLISASLNPTNFSATGLPPGLSIDASSGYISGVPTTVGTYQTVISATNTAGTGKATITTVIAPPSKPALSCAATVSGAVASAFAYIISASNGATSFGATGLPPGLSVNTVTGLIQGTPTAQGVFQTQISATNAVGTVTGTLTTTIFQQGIVAPVITSSALLSGTVGTALSFQLKTNNPSKVTYGASNLPPGLSLAASSGIISGTPTAAGSYLVLVSATSAAGTGTATLKISIIGLDPPVFSVGAVWDMAVGQASTHYLLATNNPTGYSFTGLPPGMTADPVAGVYSGTPTTAGVYRVGVTATNAAGTTSATLTMNISGPYVPPTPVISSAAGIAAITGQPLYYAVYASDSPISFAIENTPLGLMFDTATGVLTGTPVTAGSYTFTVSAINQAGTGRGTIRLDVFDAPAGGVPIITSRAGAQAHYNDQFHYAVIATNSPTSFTASGLPPGLSFNASTGVISGKPTNYDVTYPVTLTAKNAAGTGQGIVTIRTTSIAAPLHFIHAGATRAAVGQSFNFALTCNGTATTYSATGLPAGLSLNTGTGVISGTPSAAGTHIVSLTGTNNVYNTAGRLVITVAASTSTALPDMTSAAGIGGYANTPLAYALTGGNLPTTFSATDLPAGLSLDAATGVISGVPTVAGTPTATVTLTNSAGTTTAYLSFNLSAAHSGVLEITSPADVGGYAGAPVSYPVTWAPPGTSYYNGASASNLPYRIFFDANKNTFYGTPPSATTAAASFSVMSDGAGAAGQVMFNISATPLTTLPVFTSAASTVGVTGSSFYYTPAATNNPTTFTATSLPPGLSFDPSTNLITGTPTATGMWLVPLTATNATGQNSAALTVIIRSPSTPLPDFNDGTPLEIVGNVGASTFHYLSALNVTSYAASGLPPGVSLDASSGLLNGTPTATGTFPVLITASNSSGSATAVVTYRIAPALVSQVGFGQADGSSRFNAGMVVFVSLPIDPLYLSANGTPTSITADQLPPGLSLTNINGGTITGAPTTPGLYSVTLTSTNENGTGTAVLTILVKNLATLQPLFPAA